MGATFAEKYLAGEIPFEKIHDFVSTGKQKGFSSSLPSYLGLTEKQYVFWLTRNDEALKTLLLSMKK